MDNAVLKKRLNTFKNSEGRLENVSDEVVMEVLRSWESWPGSTAELYRELDLSKMQMVSMLKKGKKLLKSGVFTESEFHEVAKEEESGAAPATSHTCIEISWEKERVIRFSQVDQLIDFLSKYCDLIPIERYCKMVARQGLPRLPPHSLIELTHYLADFLKPVYDLIRKEVQSSRVLHADETPHRMLEGSSKANGYLCGFSNMQASYFECHGTRSGDVAWRFLQESGCQYLMSDVFSGYIKAVRLANKERLKGELFQKGHAMFASYSHLFVHGKYLKVY